MSNRHERRRQARLADFSGLGEVSIVDPEWMIARLAVDAGFARSMAAWIATMPGRRPLCLTCPAVFDDGNRPRLWAITRPNVGRRDAVISGMCDECSRGGDPMAAVLAALEREGMMVRPLGSANLMHAGGNA